MLWAYYASIPNSMSIPLGSKEEGVILLSAGCWKAPTVPSGPHDCEDVHVMVRPIRYDSSLSGSLCNTHNPTLRLFFRTCLHTTSDDNQTSPEHTTQRPSKHHHNGHGAVNPSGGVDLMNPHRLRGGRPCE
jgi:hypothetical protein